MPSIAKDATSRAVPEPIDPLPAVREREASGPVLVQPRPASSLGPLLVALAELAAVCGSLYLCFKLFSLSPSESDSLMGSNALPAADRSMMLRQLFAAALSPVLLCGLVYLRYGAAALRWLPRAAELASPLLLSCFLPTLLNYARWYDKPLPYLFTLAVFVLVLERLLTRAFMGSRVVAGYQPTTSGVSTRLSRYAPLVVVLVFGLGYAAYMSYWTIIRHRGLNTAGFDLGIFDNLMFNALHGRPFHSTVAVPNGSYLSNHAEYGMYLFVPIYALFPHPETMLVLQSTFMGLAAWPLYMFASKLITRPVAAAISVAYLFFAPLHGPNFYDFHWMPMAMFFVFWLFYAIVQRNVLWIVLLSIIVCSMREDAAFCVIATGLYLIVTKHWVKLGAHLALWAAAWFLLVKFVIMPWAGPWWFADIYKELMGPGEKGWGSIGKTILINPNYFLQTLLTQEKLIYALHMVAPLAFLPLRHPAQLLLMMPGFIVTLMTTGYAPTVSISFQYTTTWIPFLFGAVALSLHARTRKLGVRAQRASAAALCVGVLCHSYVFGAILQHNTFVGGFSRIFFSLTPAEEKRYQDMTALARRIPPNASAAATETVIPHISNRLDAYTLKITAGQADYLLLYRHHLDSDTKRRVREALNAHPYGLVEKRGDFYLFAKDVQSKQTESSLKSLGLSSKR
ncbi:MAG TPA: DUF2079 domain-containing protein [Polyangiales bacterium]|nr:DUF2079 domain-containing protein [Polyangiales bacterium]